MPECFVSKQTLIIIADIAVSLTIMEVGSRLNLWSCSWCLCILVRIVYSNAYLNKGGNRLNSFKVQKNWCFHWKQLKHVFSYQTSCLKCNSRKGPGFKLPLSLSIFCWAGGILIEGRQLQMTRFIVSSFAFTCLIKFCLPAPTKQLNPTKKGVCFFKNHFVLVMKMMQ